jgi:hypothetical protein
MSRTIAILLLLCPLSLLAQSSRFDSVNRERNRIVEKGMLVLTGWGVANIGTGLVGMANTTGETRAFHRANVFAGSINVLFGQLSYWVARSASKRSSTPLETLREQEKAEKLFLLNTGIDLAYVALGAYIKERGNRFTGEDRSRQRGLGSSLMLQGAFLFVFDGVMYLLQNRNGNRLTPGTVSLELGSTANGLGLCLRF